MPLRGPKRGQPPRQPVSTFCSGAAQGTLLLPDATVGGGVAPFTS